MTYIKKIKEQMTYNSNEYSLESIYREINSPTTKENYRVAMKKFFSITKPLIVINFLGLDENLLKNALNSDVVLYNLNPSREELLKYLDRKNKELYGYSILNSGVIDAEGNTIPMVAIKNGNINVLKDCLANGCEISSINVNEDNLLSLLFKYESKYNIVENFKKRINNFNNINFYDDKEKEIIKECINVLSDVDDEEERYNILEEYAKYEYNHFVDFLLTKNIGLLNNKNAEGINPLLIAAKNNSIACDTIFKNSDIDLDAIDRDGNNALMLLIKNNNIEAVNDIFNNNENIPLYTVNKQGLKAIDLAKKQPIRTIERKIREYENNMLKKLIADIPNKGLYLKK